MRIYSGIEYKIYMIFKDTTLDFKEVTDLLNTPLEICVHIGQI